MGRSHGHEHKEAGHEHGNSHDHGGDHRGEGRHTTRDPVKSRSEAGERRADHDLRGGGGDVPTFEPGGASTSPAGNGEYGPIHGEWLTDAARLQGYDNAILIQAQNVPPGRSVEMTTFGNGNVATTTGGDAPLAQGAPHGDGELVVAGHNEYENTTTVLGADTTQTHDNTPTETYSNLNPIGDGDGGGGGDGNKTDPDKKWSNKKKALTAVGLVTALTFLGVGTYFLGRGVGWWGCSLGGDGPVLTDRSRARSPRGAGGALTPVEVTLRDPMTPANAGASPLDPTTLRFYGNAMDAIDPEQDGTETLDVTGGTWSSKPATDGTNVVIVFTPDGTSKDDPAPIWVRVRDIGCIRSNAAKITISYVAATVPKTAPTDGTAPVTTDFTIDDKRYDRAFFIDPFETHVTQGSAALDPQGLVLVREDGEDALTLPFGNSSTWEVDKTGPRAKLTFYPGANFAGGTHALKFRVYDVDGRASNVSTITVAFVTPPIFSMTRIGAGKLARGDTLDVDVLKAATKGSAEIDLTSLVLKGTIKLDGAADATFDDADKVTYSNGETRGYLRLTIPGEGVWEVIDQDNRAKLRFTVDADDFDTGSIVAISVADVNGDESADGKVHIAEIYQQVFEAIQDFLDRDDDAFWAKFREAVITPSDDEISLGVMASVVDELLRVATIQARAKDQLNSIDPTLKFANNSQFQLIRDSWMNSGDKAALLDLVLSQITYDVTGDPPAFQTRSYWNRRIRLNTLRTFLIEYNGFLRTMMM